MPLTISKITDEHNNKVVELMGILSDCRRILTKSKKEMLLGTLADLRGELRVLVFQNDDFEDFVQVVQDDNIVRVSGRLRINDDEMSIRCDSVDLIDQGSHERHLVIDVDHVQDLALLAQVKKVTRQYRGHMPLFFQMGDKKIKAHKKYWVADDAICFSQLENLMGSSNVWVAQY